MTGFFETLLIKIGATATASVASKVFGRSAANFYSRYLAPVLSRKNAKPALKESLKAYLARLDKATKSIGAVAISGGPRPLTEIYVPLTLIDNVSRLRTQLDRHPVGLLNESRCLLITDTAGMGKSTVMKFLVQSALVQLTSVPVLVELRRIEPGAKLFEHICGEIYSNEADKTPDIEALFDDGKFLLMLDGYDEIEDGEKKRLNGEIHELTQRFDKCQFVLASRPDGELQGLSEFKHVSILPLSKHEAFSLIKKYDPAGHIADRLISKVKASPQVHEFLGNPLLVSLLYRAFDHKATIPLKRYIFFRQVYDALFQDHDLSKGAGYERKKKSGLDIEDFHKAVRAVGAITFLAGKVQYGSEEFRSMLEKASQLTAPLPFEIAKLREDLVSAVPILVKEGTDVRWSHKAFQDYFMAQYIMFDATSIRAEIVDRILDPENARRNENVLLMLAEQDRQLVLRSVVAPLLRSMVSQFNASTYVTQPCGFERFLIRNTGGVFHTSPKYVQKTQRLEFDGDFDLVAHLQSVLSAPVSRVSISFATTAKGNVTMVAATPLVDSLVLLKVLEPSIARDDVHDAGFAWFDSLSRACPLEDSEEIKDCFAGLPLGDSSDFPDLVRAYESAFDIRVFSLSRAVDLIAQADRVETPSADWLLALARGELKS